MTMSVIPVKAMLTKRLFGQTDAFLSFVSFAVFKFLDLVLLSKYFKVLKNICGLSEANAKFE